MNGGSICGGRNGRIGSAAFFVSFGLLFFIAASILINAVIVTFHCHHICHCFIVVVARTIFA